MGHDFKDIFGDWEPTGPDDGSNDRDERDLEPENRGPRDLREKEVKVAGVFEHSDSSGITPSQFFVLLQDNLGRKVPIWIGKFEALAISMSLEGETSDRPLTHDLIRLMLDRLGVTVERVVIDDLWQDTFYAKITLVQGDVSHEVDCRPSDAVAIAVRTRAPIYMAESVIESVEQKL